MRPMGMGNVRSREDGCNQQDESYCGIDLYWPANITRMKVIRVVYPPFLVFIFLFQSPQYHRDGSRTCS
jgi:hypothetical protein